MCSKGQASTIGLHNTSIKPLPIAYTITLIIMPVKWLAYIWALIPLYNIYNFAICPIEHITDDGKGMKISNLGNNASPISPAAAHNSEVTTHFRYPIRSTK